MLSVGYVKIFYKSVCYKFFVGDGLMRVPSGLVLSEGERVLWYGRRSFKSLIGWIVLGLLTVWILGLGIVLLLVAVLKWWQTEYAITNKRVYSKTGIISRTVHDAPLEKVTDATFHQSFIGRLLNFGTVSINTAGMGGYEVNFVGVSDPVKVRAKVQDATDMLKRLMRIQGNLENLEFKYLAGEITREQFEAARRKIMESAYSAEAMFCPYCGAKIQHDYKFCPKCGGSIQKVNP